MRFIALVFILSFSMANADYVDITTYKQHVGELKYRLVDGNRIAYIDEGEGQPIVLMHGIPTNSWMYRKIIPRLVAAGHRVIAPDLLGMGQSEKTKDTEKLMVPSQAKVMLGLLEKLEVSNWKHVVHDFAGPITWEMMKDERFKASELILLNTFLFSEGFKPGLNIGTRALLTVATIKPLRKMFYKKAIKSMVLNKKFATKNMLEGYVQPLQNGASYTYKKLYFSANKLKTKLPEYQESSLQMTDRMTRPVKLIWGQYDKFLSSKTQVEKLKEHFNIEDKNIKILIDGKHIITEERPVSITNMILK